MRAEHDSHTDIFDKPDQNIRDGYRRQVQREACAPVQEDSVDGDDDVTATDNEENDDASSVQHDLAMVTAIMDWVALY